MGINIKRLMADLYELGKIGFIPGKGTSRVAYSENFLKGRELIRSKMEEAGLLTSIDAVGNLTGLLPASNDDKMAKKIAVGSHIDTVPMGGIYDGALGVISAIEAVRALKEEGWANRHPIEVIAFNEEEGNAVGGTFGSKAFAGAVLEESMREPMALYHISEKDFRSCKRRAEDYLAYLEYHIEQGGLLEAKGMTIGIVEGIFGILRYKAIVKGMANHAGSTPMALRDDAMEKTCRMITWLMDKVRATGDTMVCTIGTMDVEPGAVNVIPGETSFVIELRDKEMTGMYEVIDNFRNEWKDKGLRLEEYITQPETLCDKRLCLLAENAADEKKYAHMRMYSGAGHDLINMSFIAPSALLFIPSKGGISHRYDEYSSPEDIKAGAEVFLETIKKIDKGEFEIEN